MAGYQTVPQRNLTCAIRIRERRRELALTQAEVVNRVSNHGSRLSNQALSAIENGRRLAVGRLPDLAGALDCTVTYLLGLTADPHRWTPDEQTGEQAGARPAEQTGEQAGARPAEPTGEQAGVRPGEHTGRPADAPSRPRRPAAPTARDPIHSPRRSWILGPDVPDTPGELGNQAHDVSTTPRPR